MLPNLSRSRVEREKIIDYLLSLTHPEGRNKAEFFNHFGFRLEEWEVLMVSLLNHSLMYPVAGSVESEYGVRYSIDGELETPDGRNPRVRTVWIIEKGNVAPRLVTAHPLGSSYVQGT